MWTDFFRSRYVRSLEQQVVELKAEKAEQKQEIARLQRLLVPGLRAMEREALPKAVTPARITVKREPEEKTDRVVERMPPVRSWMQARDQAEQLSETT